MAPLGSTPADFHAYEKALGERFLIPLLRRDGFDPAGKSVLDVGCGYGGVLAALAGAHPLGEALGVDLDAGMIGAGGPRCPAPVRLEARDFFSLGEGAYDLVLLRDVLEHIGDVEGALRKAARLLRPGGRVYASFAPFASPFGGHQHNAAGLPARIPWIHLLPEPAFRALLRLPGNAYKSGAALEEDMASVLRTRLTLARFRRAAAAAGLRPRHRAQWLSRPDYRLKFGVPSLGFPPVPLLEELLCTGAEAILEAA